MKQWTAGLVFAGTPHVHDKPDSLRKALRNTVKAFNSPGDPVDDSQIREYVTAVGKANQALFHLPGRPNILSLWEGKAPGPPQGSEGQGNLIVSQECRVERLEKHTERTLQRDHADLLRFSGVYDPSFMTLVEELNIILRVALIFGTLLAPQKRPPTIIDGPKTEAATTEKLRDPPHPAPVPSRSEDKTSDMYQFWARKDQVRDRKASKATFLESLTGWTEANTGNHISPAPGTCLWATTDPDITLWKDAPMVNRLFITSSAGRGKTYFLRALQEQIQFERPQDTVLSFFCSPGKGRPLIWEYFTSALLQKESWLFGEIPSRYREIGKSSKLGLGSFVDIWHAFRQAIPNNNIWLLVDGLEQCGEDHFQDFFMSYKELFSRPHVLKRPLLAPAGGLPKEPTTIKIIFTCRATPAVTNAQLSSPRAFMDSKNTSRDIAAYVDLKLDPMVDALMYREMADYLKDLKRCIKELARAYWPFAVYAVEDAQRNLPFGIKGPLSVEDDMPHRLKQWYRDKLSPHIQSLTGSWLARTVLNVCISQSYNGLLSVKQVHAVLRCLSNGEHNKQADLIQVLLVDYGDIIRVRSDWSIAFVHPSLAWYATRLLSLEQRHANMAFICLRYLLQDVFKDSLEMETRGATEDEKGKWLEDAYPFYDYAGSDWPFHLKGAGHLADQLLPLVKEFINAPGGQTRTWAEWRAAFQEGTTRLVPPEQQAIVVLIGEGSFNVLERLLPNPNPAAWYSRERFGAWATALTSFLWTSYKAGSGRDLSIMGQISNWTELTDRRGQTALMGAVFSGCIDMVQLVLRHKPSLDAYSDLGDTALMCSLPSPDSNPVEEYDCTILELLLQEGANPNICHAVVWATCLHQACFSGLIEPTRLLLQHNALLGSTDISGVTPLQCAYESKNVAVVQELLDAGADPDVWWRGSITPLDRCIHEGNLPMFRVFLEWANVNGISGSGLAPVHAACRKPDRLEFLKLILSRPDVDVNIPIKSRWGLARGPHPEPLKAISMAAERGNCSAVELLLLAGASSGTVWEQEYTPLHYAVLGRNTTLARLLLEHDARVNVITRQDGVQTPLGLAVSQQDEDMVRLLLEYGADPTIDEGYGRQGLLSLALQSDSPNYAIIEKLLESRFKPTVNPTSQLIDHPLYLAAHNGTVELVRLLLDHGADLLIWLEPADWCSPLHIAVTKGNRELSELLIQREPGLLNVQSEHGYQRFSTLLAACQSGKSGMVRFLLEKGADPSSVAFHSKESALLLSCTAGDHEAVEALLSAAPEMVNLPALQGETPLIRACAQKDLRIIEMLLLAGADVEHRNARGDSCVYCELFDRDNGPVEGKLELLIKHGLDINAVVGGTGLTVLGVAIEHGEIRTVNWLIGQGADLSRCQRSPSEPVIWRNGLQVACDLGKLDQVRLILKSDWFSQEALRARDWFGGSVLPLGPPELWSVKVTQAIYWACEEERSKTGLDIFSELMSQPCINGLTPLDWRLQPAGCARSARRQLDDTIRHHFQELLPRPRSRGTHTAILEELARLLLWRGGHDAEAEFLLQMALTLPFVAWDFARGRYFQRPILATECHICGEYDFDIVWICVSCTALYCDECVAIREREWFHVHEWIDIRLFNRDWNGDAVQGRLEELARRTERSHGDGLSPIEEEPEFFGGLDATLDQDEPNDQVETGFQLAMLHAFGYLAIRRPLFTPHLPLSAAAEAAIAPWGPLIRDQRQRVELANLSLETSPARLEAEQSYVRRGLANRYADEGDVRYGFALEALQGLYEEKELAVDRRHHREGPIETNDMNDNDNAMENEKSDDASNMSWSVYEEED